MCLCKPLALWGLQTYGSRREFPERQRPAIAELRSNMKVMRVTVKVAAFYKFVSIDDPAVLQGNLREACVAQGIKGTILIANEGINATVSGLEREIDTLIQTIISDARFSDLEVKYSEAAEHPFQRLKVKIKKEIVTFGVPDAKPSVATGTFVEPGDWNALISDPDVLVIDTRNDYEVQIGTFEGAQNPETRAFNEFPDFVRRTLADDCQRKIAMFCTGGIRCEKASAFLLREGVLERLSAQRRHTPLLGAGRARGKPVERRVLRFR